jgi:hypothetical protein
MIEIKKMHTQHKRACMLYAYTYVHAHMHKGPAHTYMHARIRTYIHSYIHIHTYIGVRKLYERSFFRIRRFPKPTTPELEERFTEMLEDIKTEHNNVQANIARGLQACYP